MMQGVDLPQDAGKTAASTRWALRPRLVPSLIAAAMLAVLLGLGTWQARRYFESRAAWAHYAAQHDQPPVASLGEVPGSGEDLARLQALHFRRAVLRGRIDASAVHLLTARYKFAQRGYEVMAPLTTTGGPLPKILVHLGWVAESGLAAYLDQLARAGEQEVRGRLQVPPLEPAQRQVGSHLGRPTWLRAWPKGVAAQVPGLEPRLMLQAGEQASGKPVPAGKVPLDGYVHPVRLHPTKHIEYAGTWYGLALTLIAIWIAFSLVRVPTQAATQAAGTKTTAGSLVLLAGLLAQGCGAAGGERHNAGGDVGAADAGNVAGADAHDDGPDPAILAAVDPFIGTAGLIANLGNTSPAATAPLGLVKAGPDTTPLTGQPAFSHTAGYQGNDKYLIGFSHNRLHGTGIPDYGNVLLLPVAAMDSAKATRYGRKVALDHASQRATPGWYAVQLHEPEIAVEIAATPRCAVHRYRFEATGASSGTVLVDAAAVMASGRSRGGAVVVDRAKGRIHGWNHAHGAFSGRYGGYKVHFVVAFDRPASDGGVWHGESDGGGLLRPLAAGQATDQVETSDDPARFGAWLTFAKAGEATAPSVEARVCLSYTDLAGAEAALHQELGALSLEQARQQTEALWLGSLGRVRVEGASAETRTRLYTALYHALQMPTLWSDVDGRYMGFDRKIHLADGWRYVTDMSLWDTFRTTHPLYSLLFPEVQRDALRSLVAMRQQGGYVPRWPMGGGDGGSMIGAHAASVAADAVVKGIDDFDAVALYEGLSQTYDANLPAGSYGNLGGIEDFHALGYVPRDGQDGSVSKTMEYAYGCACMATLAAHVGKTADAARWQGCAGHYQNLWDAGSGFFRARHKDGTFTEPFKPTLWDFSGNPEYVEGSAWQWLWFAPHDDAGLRALLGGAAMFRQRLDFFLQQTLDQFSHVIPTSYYYHGNEPDIDAAWLFAEAGAPERTQFWTRTITTTMILNQPDGLPGNDDGGTLAAWTVFATLGLYPRPGRATYLLSAPLVDRAQLHLRDGAVVTIEATGAGDLPAAMARHIAGYRWNDAPLPGPTIEHKALVAGGTLRASWAPAP